MRLIDAGALLEQIPVIENWDEKVSLLGVTADFICMICDAPTIEAKPVVHAHWEYAGESEGKKIYRCTNCQMLLPGTGNFCKECGAQMDEEVSG